MTNKSKETFLSVRFQNWLTIVSIVVGVIGTIATIFSFLYAKKQKDEKNKVELINKLIIDTLSVYKVNNFNLNIENKSLVKKNETLIQNNLKLNNTTNITNNTVFDNKSINGNVSQKNN